MKGRQLRYTTAELAWIEARAKMGRAETHRDFQRLFNRADVSLPNFNALCKRRGWLTGRTGCFAPGAVPANKGKTMPYHPNSAAHRFRQGERRGVAVKLYKPIGTERLSKNGYLERKVNDDLPLQKRWRAVHLVRWEELHGPVPKGMALKCLGDKLDTAPSNWTLISRAMLPRLNGGRSKKHVAYDAAPAELKPTILAVATLEHRARIARKK